MNSHVAKGCVYLVGAGVGHPDFLTVRAARYISQADVVVHDRLVHEQVLALCRTGARLIYAGKDGRGSASTPQHEINALLIQHAKLGRSVVRLKGGDPFVFGRGGEEALALAAANVSFEIVPGLSSGIAGPALAGIPVTHRDWKHLASAETLVLFMGGLKLQNVTFELTSSGLSGNTPAALIEAAGWESQRVLTTTVADLAACARAAALGSPALVVIGEVVAIRAQLQAFLLDTFSPPFEESRHVSHG
jgi:uroporphyrin-III C-methyltransferase